MNLRGLALSGLLALCACNSGNAFGTMPDAGSPPPDGSGSVPSDGGGDLGANDLGAGPGQDLAGAIDLASPSDAGTHQGGSDGSTSSCGPCDHPPSACYAPAGTCQGGKCVYTLVDGLTCDDGDPCTVGDICSSGVCAGTPKTCDQPPASVCSSGSQLLTYDKVGVCKAGACVYKQEQVTCGSGGCQNGACQTDPCSGITCDTPPSICFKSSGSCSGGQCSYAYNDGATCDDGNPCTTGDQCATGACQGVPIACLSPPADSCVDSVTLKSYDPAGSCSAGSCSYPYHYVTCSSGCSNGQCKAAPWTALSSGVTVTLNGVWGASGSDVFAVGDQGTIIRYNGSQWKTMGVPSGTTNVEGIDGTASNNVFAITATPYGDPGQVLRWDGSSWTQKATVACYDFCCVGAIGTDDAFTWNSYGELDRITNGTVTKVANITEPETLDHHCDVRVLSPTDVYFSGAYVYHYDGKTITELAPATGTAQNGQGVLAFGPTQVMTFSYSATARWDGTQWISVPTGTTGAIYGLGGTSFSRIFAAGGVSSGSSGTWVGTVSFWDGTGWTGETLPSGTPSLSAVWAAPTGEVYAVGASGTILRAIH